MAQLTTAGKAKLIVSGIISLVSLILGIVAFGVFSADTAYYNGVVENWETDPVADMQFVPSPVSGNPCASLPGYTVAETADLTVAYCDCARATPSSGITSGACSKADSDRNCTTESRNFPVSRAWKFLSGSASSFCIRRLTGQNALARVRRPYGGCEAGMKPCGALGDCYPVSDDCPIVDFQVVQGLCSNLNSRFLNPPANRANDTFTRQAYGGNSTTTPVLCVGFTRAYSGLMGINALPVTQVRIGPGTYPSNPDGATGYVAIDSNSAENIAIANNLQTQLAAIGWTNLAPLASIEWSISQRREIDWGQSASIQCPETREAIVDVKSTVNVVYTMQLILMIISIIVFLTNTSLLFKEYKDKTDDNPDNDEKHAKIRTRCGLIGETVNIIPTVVALVFAFQKAGFFDNLKNANCSDTETNSRISSLASTMNKVGTINVVKFVVMFPYFLFRVYKFCKGDAPGTDSTRGGATSS